MITDLERNTLPYLLEKLDFIKLQPQHTLIVGHAELQTATHEALQQRYPFAQYDFVSGSICDYPTRPDYYNLIFCHWLQPAADLGYELLFYIFHHFMTEQGLLLFSCDTSCAAMQYLGDSLLKLGYQDPVIDKDKFTDLELAYGHAWKKEVTTC
jgi:hypothetical protein